MSQKLQNFAKFQIFQLENLIDFGKCCKTRIFLQRSVPIQPKTSNILPKFCQPTLSDVSAGKGAAAGGAGVRRGLRLPLRLPRHRGADPAASAAVRGRQSKSRSSDMIFGAGSSDHVGVMFFDGHFADKNFRKRVDCLTFLNPLANRGPDP